MKALSIQQPWAWCITHATKRIENRIWFGHHRGPLLIHAGKKYQTGVEQEIHDDSPECGIAEMLASPRGVIVGICEMVACVRSDEVAADQRIWAGGEWCFVFANVRAFAEPVPWKGALGFFEVELSRELRTQIESATARSGR